MAPPDPGSASKSFHYHENSYTALVVDILENAFYTIIHDTVLEVHRAEKILRMNSAAVQAVNAASAIISQSNSDTQPAAATPVTGSQAATVGSATGSGAGAAAAAAAAALLAKNAVPVQQLPQVKVTTSSATYDHGRVYLAGNPLKTVKEVFCSQCRLPRLPFPLKGAGSRPPDLSKHTQWCNLHPFIRLSGHDIYGNSFPTEQAKTKKERELQKQQARAERDAANRQAATEDADSPAAVMARLTAESGKPANYIPWHTCPNCKRSLLITRFAQHLEKCLGISGRTSSRTAMSRITAAAATGSRGTPVDSRAASPIVTATTATTTKKGAGLAGTHPSTPSTAGLGVTFGPDGGDDEDGPGADGEDAKPLRKKKATPKRAGAPNGGSVSGSGSGPDKDAVRIKLKGGPLSRLADEGSGRGSGASAAGGTSPLLGRSSSSGKPDAGTGGSAATAPVPKRERDRDESVLSASDIPRKKFKSGKD